MPELHFDLQQNCASLSIDKNIYLRILDKAIEQTTGDIALLKQSLEQADIDKIQSLSHRLKGDYANLRILELSALAKEINDISKTDKDFSRMRHLYQDFNNKFDLLKKMANEFKQD